MKGEIRSPEIDFGDSKPIEESPQQSRNMGSAGKYIHSWMIGFVLVVFFTHRQMDPAACVYFKIAAAPIDS